MYIYVIFPPANIQGISRWTKQQQGHHNNMISRIRVPYI